MGWFKSNKHPARRLVIQPPEPDANRQGIAVVACVKNEEPYIEEWVRFHSAVGVRHFYIYDDGSSDGTRDRLVSLLRPDALTIVPWLSRMMDVDSGRHLNGQAIAFAHAILNFGSGYKWMAFIDVDEFLLPKNGSTVMDALSGAQGAPNISLPWHMFGTSGHSTKPAGPLLLNFTARHADPMTQEPHVSNFKCIVDPCEVTEVSVHHFKTRSFGDLTVNDAGRQFARSERKAKAFYSNQFLQLNHYYTKSREEFETKVSRGWSHDADRAKYEAKAELIAKAIERNSIDDRGMLEFVANHHLILADDVKRT